MTYIPYSITTSASVDGFRTQGFPYIVEHPIEPRPHPIPADLYYTSFDNFDSSLLQDDWTYAVYKWDVGTVYRIGLRNVEDAITVKLSL